MIKTQTKGMQKAKSQTDQGKCKDCDSVTFVWKAIHTKGRKNNICFLESRTRGRESCLDVELPTAFVKNKTH